MIPHGMLAAMHARLARDLAPPRRPHRRFCVDGAAAGWLDDTRAHRLAGYPDVIEVRADRIEFAAGIDDAASRTEAMARVARALATDGLLTGWRDERYAVAPEFGAPPWFLLERAAARFFGVRTYAAHVNGLVRHGNEVEMWIARRAPTKSIDPSMLDNLVGGGIAAGQSVASTVAKEAWEEAGIPPGLVAPASPAGEVHICREVPDGLERETIFVHDLWLPEDFLPVCRDGEVAEHRLLPLRDAAALVANATGPDIVTADASLVILDCLLRHGAIAPGVPDYAALERFRSPDMTLRADDAGA